MIKVYLAGPITGCSYGTATGWRQFCHEYLARFGITGVSPMRSKNCLSNLSSIPDTPEVPADSWQATMLTPAAVRARDKFDCTKSDLVLMNFLGANKVSKGTILEVGWADGAGVPIVAAIESENVHHNLLVDACIPFQAGTLEDALEIAVSILKP